ncbi:MAG TPA: signal peptidase I [Candidatus Acidoferrales bacterium]|nr:signal peptidase I [Candidatus Acidoferrales bacterium]
MSCRGGAAGGFVLPAALVYNIFSKMPDSSQSSSNAPAPGGAPSPDPQLRRELRGWSRDLAIALGLALGIIIFLYQPVKVEGTSMNPFLSDQERIFINKFVYHFEPIERGDVVVFWYPRDRSKSFIKRVIGLPGETLSIRDGRIYIDGRMLGEEFVPPGFLDDSNFSPQRIPPNSYFVMGDHRDSSNDSRMFGPVPRSYIYGKAVFAYWPMDHFGSLTAPPVVSAASK